MPLLRLENATCERDSEPLFRAIDIAIAPGDWLLLEGANGIGKSTLLRAIVGLHPLRATAMAFNGVDALRDRTPLIAQTRWLGHALAQKRDLSVQDNVRYALGIAGHTPPDNLVERCAEVGLDGYEDAPIRTLSAGQKKRAALLTLIAVPAQLWLLDEPYANLDKLGVALVQRLLDAHCQAGGAAVVASHGDVHFGEPSARLLLSPP